MMCTQSAIHAQPLSESTDEAQLYLRISIMAITGVCPHTGPGPESSPAPNPTWLRSTQTPSKKWHECAHNTAYMLYMDWGGRCGPDWCQAHGHGPDAYLVGLSTELCEISLYPDIDVKLSGSLLTTTHRL